MQYKNYRLKGNAKVLFNNFIALFLLQVTSYVFPFITLPYLSRVIGIEKFGEIAFATAMMTYCQAIVDYGFIYSAVRDISRCRENKLEASEIFTKVMWARFCLVFLSFFLLCLCIVFIPKLYSMRIVLFASFFTVIGHALFPDWMFQAIEKMKYITYLNLFTKLLFTILVFIVIKEQSDYIFQPILTSLGFCISGIISLILLSKMGFRIGKFCFRDSINAIRTNTDLFINQLVPNLYNSLSSVFLGFMHGSVSNGIFDAGNRFNNVVSYFVSIISRVFFPFLSRNLDKHRFYIKLHLGISILLSLILFFVAPFIIKIFFTKEFESAIIVLRILSFSLIFLSCSNIFGANYLILIGEEQILRNCTLVSSLVGFCCMIPLVYYFSYIGAAWTIFLSRGLLALTITYKALQIKYMSSKMDSCPKV